MKRRFVCLLCLLWAVALLVGCSRQDAAPAAAVTLPPAAVTREAPENDMRQNYEQTVDFYLPTPDGAHWAVTPRTAVLSASRSPAQILCDMLLGMPGEEDAASLGGEVVLSLSGTDAVEVSGQVATVSLAASALSLSHEQLFIVGQALANTLCQIEGIQYVNVLIAGSQPGLNVAATLPAGSFQPNTREELAALWARASAPASGKRAFAATLYYPAPSGKGILCEARTLSFPTQDLPGMAATLLDALYAGAEKLPGLPACPDLKGMLQSGIILAENGGTRRLALHFREEMNAALIEAGITRSVMMAALTYTLTTFLPGIDGLEITIGEEKITSLTPSGTYLGAGETILFSDGLMRRRDFVPFLLSECTLYFANDQGGLTRVQRPVPFYEAFSTRSLLQQLALGPQPFDSVTGLYPVLPDGLRAADLMGVALEDGAMLLNFSQQLSVLCADYSPVEEKCLVYALVNTVCELPGVKKAAIFIQGSQPDSLAGTLYLPGDFLPNMDLVTEENVGG